MKIDGLDHPKTLDFAARIDVPRPTAIGHLELFWNFVGRMSPRGNVGKWPDGAIARAAEWNGDPAVFVEALRDAGFLDTCDEHRYIVHDWHEHCPRWVKAKLARAKEDLIQGPVAHSSGVSSLDCSGDCSPDSVREGKGSEGKPPDRGRCGADETAPPQQQDALPETAVIAIPLNDGSEHPITESEFREMQELYPGISVMQSLRNCRGWNLANPARRKTKRGIKSHVHTWLQKDQDKAPALRPGYGGGRAVSNEAAVEQAVRQREGSNA